MIADNAFMVKLSIVIVNYNVRYFLEQSLLSVRASSKGLTVEIFVVDNNSVDDSVAMVKSRFPECILITNKINAGFAIANNQAIRRATGEYILLLNPDTVLEEQTLVACIGFMDARPQAGGVGVKMIDGSGRFLPESKRGFPSPWVAFCKAFGLSRLFPASPLFNRYHLGFLNENETHEIEVLAGAFMMLRQSVLHQIGLLDEAFFMYGEDIDLSYRIIQAGYKNYYFAGATIIHYKGESTKKGNLNYVRTFYQAMIIFGKKHFTGKTARLFIYLMYFSVYFRASLSLMANILQRFFLPIMDTLLMALGLLFLKNLWSVQYFENPNYYKPSFIYFNLPLYVSFWLGGIYLSGGYDRPLSIRRVVKGVAVGTLALAALYGFLSAEYRASRALIIFGAVWAVCAAISMRYLIHFWKYKNLSVGGGQNINLAIIGGEKESERTKHLLYLAHIRKNIIGAVSPYPVSEIESGKYLSSLDRLDEVVRIYKIKEIIFCSKDVSSYDVMYWMTRLGPSVEYKILPEESLGVIGSGSKETAGEIYTIDIRFNIATSIQRRNKRLLDIILSISFLLTLPILIWTIRQKILFIRHIFMTFFNETSWVGYIPLTNPTLSLPALKKGLFSPLSGLDIPFLDHSTMERLNFLYAKDYKWECDLEFIFQGWKKLEQII